MVLFYVGCVSGINQSITSNILFCSGFGDKNKDQEFAFAIPKLWFYKFWESDHPPHVMITTLASHPVYTTLSIPGYSLTINRTIRRNTGTNIRLPHEYRMDVGDGKQNKTIIVRASESVSVYTITNEYGGADMFQSIPSVQLGTTYYVASYPPFNGTLFPSFACLSALHSDTSVFIFRQSVLTHTVTLRPYESYRYDGGDYEDLSGTLIQSDRPIAVISGSAASYPPEYPKAPKDGLVSQLLPTKSWGSLYHIFPFLTLTNGFRYRVFASNISTTLYMPDGNVTVIPPNEFYEGEVSGEEVVSFRADQHIMVSQYMKSFKSNNPKRGDPSMLLVPPFSSYTHDVTFPVFQYRTPKHRFTYYINIVTECKNVDGLQFNDVTSVASWNTLTTDDKIMCCLRSEVSPGYHSVTHTKRANFFVSVYCLSNGPHSYAYTARGQGK